VIFPAAYFAGAAEWMHEDEAVPDFAGAMAGDGVAFDKIRSRVR